LGAGFLNISSLRALRAAYIDPLPAVGDETLLSNRLIACSYTYLPGSSLYLLCFLRFTHHVLCLTFYFHFHTRIHFHIHSSRITHYVSHPI